MEFDNKSFDQRHQPLDNWPRPLAFVLSGGGAYGATQVGMMHALRRAQIKPDMVVGSSVGALNGAVIAANPVLAVDRLARVWTSLNGPAVFGARSKFVTSLKILSNGLKRNRGLVSPDALRALIDTHVPVESIEELSIPTAIVVTDALAGTPKLLTRGAIGPALLASTAIPGVFPPIKIDGCFYLDGGVTANVPVRQAIAFGARSVIVLDANPAAMPGTLAATVTGSVLQASMIMLRHQHSNATEDLVGRYPILRLPQSTPPTQSSFDFGNSPALIESALQASTKFLGQLSTLTNPSQYNGQDQNGSRSEAQGNSENGSKNGSGEGSQADSPEDSGQDITLEV